MRTIDKIIPKVNCKYGSPMGRSNKGIDKSEEEAILQKVFDCRVPMVSNGDYGTGGAYWGIGKELRVSYTKDLNYINFYRKEN